MALPPREFPHFFPEAISTSTGQRFRGSSNFRNTTPGIPKFPVMDSTRLPDQNITLLLQQWLLNSLRGMPPLLPNMSDFQPQNFPQIPAAFSSIIEPYKQDFILQDLHQKYKKILAEYETATLRKFQSTIHLNDAKRFNPKSNMTSFPPTLSPFSYLSNPFCFPFSSPNFEKYSKPHFSRLPNEFHPLQSREPSPQIESSTKATIHHRNVGDNEEVTSHDRSQTMDSLKDKKTHKCMYCGKLYSRKYGLKIHIRTHTGYKPLKCKVCGRPFGDPSNLNKHVRLHAEGDTPYRCEFCGKVLVRRRDLERHIKSRHPNAKAKIDMFPV